MNSIELTTDQLNKILANKRIIGIHSISSANNLVVVCRDGWLRCITFNGKTLQWLDSYEASLDSYKGSDD